MGVCLGLEKIILEVIGTNLFDRQNEHTPVDIHVYFGWRLYQEIEWEKTSFLNLCWFSFLVIVEYASPNRLLLSCESLL